MKISKKHLAFIIFGAILSVTCMILSHMDCFYHSSFNGWTQEGSGGYSGFLPGIFLLGGLAEIFLLFFRHRLIRVLSVLLSVGKIVLPWLLVAALNAVGTNSMDAYFEYTLCSNIPYIITALSGLLIVQMIVMLFTLPPSHKESL